MRCRSRSKPIGTLTATNEERDTPAAAASSKVGYSAAARRKAAKLGWEKRRNEKAHRATRTTSLKPPPEEDVPAPSRRRASEPSSCRAGEPSSRRAGKRSRRLAAAKDPASAPSRDDESRRVSDLVTHLHLSRGWMEFHPSSRHGSGTATRGYIPSSIASFALGLLPSSPTPPVRSTSSAALTPSGRGAVARAANGVTGLPAVVAARETDVVGGPHPLREGRRVPCSQRRRRPSCHRHLRHP